MIRHNFENHNPKALLQTYNDAAFELGLPSVNRFSDRATAIRRTAAIYEQLQEHRLGVTRKRTADQGEADDVVDPPEIKAVHIGGKANHFELNEAGKAAVKAARAAGEAAAGRAIAANRAIREADSKGPATPPVAAAAPVLPVPSDNPAKDAEMPRLRRNPRPTDLAPKAKVYPRRPGTRQALLVELLSRPEGVTFGELYDALAVSGKPWRGVTIRSGLAWDVNHVAGYGVRSELHDGEWMASHGREYEAKRLGMIWRDEGAFDRGWYQGPLYDPAMTMAVYFLVEPKGKGA